VHQFAKLEKNYREFQHVTFKLESLAYNHSDMDYEPVGEPTELDVDDEWLESSMASLLDRAKELRKATGESFVEARHYLEESSERHEELEGLREFWHAKYFRLGDAVRRISSEAGDVFEYGRTDLNAASAYAETLKGLEGVPTDE
jgi:hypothetical protein